MHNPIINILIYLVSLLFSGNNSLKKMKMNKNLLSYIVQVKLILNNIVWVWSEVEGAALGWEQKRKAVHAQLHVWLAVKTSLLCTSFLLLSFLHSD
jgi:hypothetical protein